MSWQTELQSWMFPINPTTTDSPVVGQKAPSNPKLTIPAADGKPTIVTFLRHCGCPFAEKTFLNLRSAASSHPSIHFIAISHSDKASTDRWLASLPDSSLHRQSNLEIIVDTEREIYAAWGLGVSSFWHVLSPWSLYSVYDLGRREGIWNRPTESGSRWQISGSFVVDGDGRVGWGGRAKGADDIPDFGQAVKALETKIF